MGKGYSEKLIKSRDRVTKNAEVFTPHWLVNAMLDLVKDETQRIDSRFLEPSCGTGNFLVEILKRKLAAVERKYGSDLERGYFALYGLMCCYGVEILEDNVAECRKNMLEAFAATLRLDSSCDLYKAAAYVILKNVVHGDFLKMLRCDGSPIIFTRWSYIGNGKFEGLDFRMDELTGELIWLLNESGPKKTLAPIKVRGLAGLYEQVSGANLAFGDGS